MENSLDRQFLEQLLAEKRKKLIELENALIVERKSYNELARHLGKKTIRVSQKVQKEAYNRNWTWADKFAFVIRGARRPLAPWEILGKDPEIGACLVPGEAQAG